MRAVRFAVPELAALPVELELAALIGDLARPVIRRAVAREFGSMSDDLNARIKRAAANKSTF